MCQETLSFPLSGTRTQGSQSGGRLPLLKDKIFYSPAAVSANVPLKLLDGGGQLRCLVASLNFSHHPSYRTPVLMSTEQSKLEVQFFVVQPETSPRDGSRLSQDSL